MQFGIYETQIFISLSLILGASLVALICDYLKGRNEQLRELAVELKVRNEESEKLVGLLRSSESVSWSNARYENSVSVANPRPESTRVLSRAQAPAGRATAAPRRTAMADAELPAAAPDILQQVVEVASARHEAAQVKAVGAVKATIRKDWDALLAARRTHPPQLRETPAQPPAAGLLDAIVAASVPSVGGVLPSGLQSSSTLERLARSGHPISGLVVALKIHSSPYPGAAVDSPAAATSCIAGLLEDGEFAAPIGNHEFILISPGLQGAFAQRRLSRLTQSLWDLQLGSIGNSGLQFIWGGLPVQDQPMDQAIEVAAERLAAEHDPLAASASPITRTA